MCSSESIDPVPVGGALTCLILNILFPPLGTWIHACMSEHYHVSFLHGMAQFLLLVLFLPAGWIYAIVYGVSIYQSAIRFEGARHGAFVMIPNQNHGGHHVVINQGYSK